METLQAGDATVTIDHEHGGRLASLTVAGHELLVTDRAGGPMTWGAFPMVPWAGRIRHGRFRHGRRDVHLPLGLPPHAIHGTTYTRPWTATGPGTLSCRLGPEWPWSGTAFQRIELEARSLTATIRVEADDPSEGPMPVTAGWHPWFRRTVGGAAVELLMPAAHCWTRDAEGIPSGELTDVPPGPWDDCFTGLIGPVALRWPGVLQLVVDATTEHVVVYDQPDHAVCVEPQSAPPDAHNSGVDLTLVTPGAPFEITTIWTWRTGS